MTKYFIIITIYCVLCVCGFASLSQKTDDKKVVKGKKPQKPAQKTEPKKRLCFLLLAAFGLRYLIVLPITLLLAVFSIGGALQLRRGRKKGSAKGKGPYGPDHYLRFAVCALVLLAGVIAELVWVPKLFQLALAGMM